LGKSITLKTISLYSLIIGGIIGAISGSIYMFDYFDNFEIRQIDSEKKQEELNILKDRRDLLNQRIETEKQRTELYRSDYELLIEKNLENDILYGKGLIENCNIDEAVKSSTNLTLNQAMNALKIEDNFEKAQELYVSTNGTLIICGLMIPSMEPLPVLPPPDPDEVKEYLNERIDRIQNLLDQAKADYTLLSVLIFSLILIGFGFLRPFLRGI